MLASITNETSCDDLVFFPFQNRATAANIELYIRSLDLPKKLKKIFNQRLTSACIDVSSEDEDDRGLDDVDADAESAVSAGLCKADEASPKNVAARTIESLEACFKD